MKCFMRIFGSAAVTLIITAIAFYIAFDYLERSRTFEPSETGLDAVIEKDLKKIKLENALIDGFELKKELITRETALSVTVTWDESWGALGIFRKSQRVRFSGVGIYVCDLNKISRDDIKVDFKLKKVSVAIPKPEIKSVTIDETKTQYEDVSKGRLRFGSIKLTQQQYAAIYNSVKQAMNEGMKSDKMVKEAEDSSISAVAEVFGDILNSVGESYTVNVYVNHSAP